MLIIDVKENGGIEKALKVLKRKFTQTQVIKELRERQTFTKSSVRKRNTKKKAIHRENYRLNNVN